MEVSTSRRFPWIKNGAKMTNRTHTSSRMVPSLGCHLHASQWCSCCNRPTYHFKWCKRTEQQNWRWTASAATNNDKKNQAREIRCVTRAVQLLHHLKWQVPSCFLFFLSLSMYLHIHAVSHIISIGKTSIFFDMIFYLLGILISVFYWWTITSYPIPF